MRYLFLLLIPLFLIAKPVKIASYNVENLFDVQQQGMEYKEYIPGRHNWNRRMMEIKLHHIAEVLCDLDADIVGLQEVENAHALELLRGVLQRVGCAYPYSAITSKRGAPIQVAMLSRVPIKRVGELQVSRAPRVRNILEVEVEIEGSPLILFVNHWKSKAYEGLESKRIAYAKRLRKRLNQLPAKREYILLGDFNSDYNAYLTLSKKNDDTAGRTAFNDVLGTRVNGLLVCEDQICNTLKPLHYSLWHELPVAKRWSQKFFGKRSTPDQIVLPPSMFDGRGVDYVNNSFGVFHAKYLFTKKGYINRWRYKNGKHMAKGYSDHLPVYALFDTKAYQKEPVKAKKNSPDVRTIDDLYRVEHLESPIILKDISVVFKRRGNAIIKQHKDGRGIFLYACAHALKEGKHYDLLVEEVKEYKGLKEIISAYSIKERGESDPSELRIRQLDGHLKQNEVIEDIAGIYRKKHLYVGDRKIPIYFKNRKWIPPEGSRLKIDYAHLGYYKKLQLVIYSKKDFRIME